MTEGLSTVCLYDPDSALVDVAAALSETGHSTRTVADRQAAASACTEGVDCLLIADTESTDGAEVAEWFLDRDVDDDAAVVVYTTREGHEPLRVARGTGVDDTLRVPPDRSALLSRRIEAAVANGADVASEAKQLRSLFRSFPHTLFIKDEFGRFASLSRNTADKYGYEPETVTGLTDFELFAEDHARDLYREEQRIVESGDSVENKIEHYVDESGTDRWVSTTKVPRYDDDGDVVGVVGGTRYVTTAKRQERLIADLHEASQRLLRATAPSDVASVAVDIAVDLNLFARAEVALVENGSLASTAAAGETPRLYDDHVPAFERTVETGEATVIDGEGKIVSLSDHGAFAYELVESVATDAFVDRLVRIYTSNIVAALDRAEREQQLTETTRRVEEFATLGSHELRNKLQVVIGNVADAQRAYDDPRLERSLATLDRIDRMLEQLLQLARTGSVAHAREWHDLKQAAREAWTSLDSGDATLTVTSTATVEANPDALVSLFEFLLENVTDHAGDDVTAVVGSLSDRAGFYVEDDGSGIDAEDPQDLFSAEYTQHEDSGGYGLYVTDAITDAHDWAIDITESEEGGARFEITGVTERVEY